MMEMPLWLVLVILFLLFDFVLVVWVFFWKRRSRKFDAEQLNYIRSHWIRIIDSFEAHPGQAVMDADKLLDYALKCKGFEGSLGQKLKKAGGRFSDLNGVWSAHKLRNRLAHELGDPKVGEAKAALSNFKKALKDLGANL